MGVSGSKGAVPAQTLTSPEAETWCPQTPSQGSITFAPAATGTGPPSYTTANIPFPTGLLELGMFETSSPPSPPQCGTACEPVSYAAHDARALLATVAAHNAAVCGCTRRAICPQPPPVLATCNDCRRYDINDTARDPRQGFPTSAVQHGTMSASQGHPGSTPCSADLIITVHLELDDTTAAAEVGNAIDLHIVLAVLDYVGSTDGPARPYYVLDADTKHASVAVVVPGGLALALVGCAREVTAAIAAFLAESALEATVKDLGITVSSVGAYVRAADAGCPHRQAPPPTYSGVSTAAAARPRAALATRVPPCKRVEWRGATDDLTANAASAAVLGAVEGGRWLIDGPLGYPATSAPGAPGRGTAGTVSVGVNPPQSGAQMSVTELMALSRLAAVLPYGSCTPGGSC